MREGEALSKAVQRSLFYDSCTVQGLLHIVKGYTVHVNSVEMFTRVQYINLYCIEACAWGKLTRNLTCHMLLYNMTNIAFLLLTTPSVLTQVPT